MALDLNPHDKARRAERAKRTKPVSVPDKKQPMRRTWAKMRNQYRRNLQRKDKAAEKTRKTLDNVGTKYKCRNCNKMIPYRIADRHNAQCAWEANEREKSAKLQEGFEKKNRQNLSNVEKIPRKPSATKTQQRQKNGTIKETSMAMGGRGSQNRSSSNGAKSSSTGSTPSSSAAHALVQAFEAWCATETKTLADLKAHHQGLDQAFGQISKLCENYAQEKLINRKFHPAVAQPVMLAADSVAGMQHFWTDSIVVFERIYAARLEHERQQGPKPEAKDTIFDEVD